MNKRKVIILLAVVLLIVISNIWSTSKPFKTYLYQTENAEFEFVTMPSKGRTEKMVERQFITFKSKNPEFSNLSMYRTFSRSPLKFWNWYDYISNKRYDYPYKEKIE